MRYYTVSSGDLRLNGYFTKEEALHLARYWSDKLGNEVEVRRHGYIYKVIGIVTASLICDKLKSREIGLI